MIRNILVFGLCALFIAFATSSGAQAKTLDKEACKTLKSERAEFLSSGILDDMAKGPEWVKANLAIEQIERIKRYLNLDATVIFQCPNGGGPKITHKKKPKSKKKAGAGSGGNKKKVIRKKVRKKNKKTSSLAFDPFNYN